MLTPAFTASSYTTPSLAASPPFVRGFLRLTRLRGTTLASHLRQHVCTLVRSLQMASPWMITFVTRCPIRRTWRASPASTATRSTTTKYKQWLGSGCANLPCLSPIHATSHSTPHPYAQRYVDDAQTQKCVLPCTPLAVVKALEHLHAYDPSLPEGNRLRGKKVTVINRSEVVGRPLAAMLANDGAQV